MWGRAGISKPLFKKPGQSWFPLQSLPSSLPGPWSSGPNSRLLRKRVVCVKRGRPEPRAYIHQAGLAQPQACREHFGCGLDSLLRTPQELKRIVFFFTILGFFCGCWSLGLLPPPSQDTHQKIIPILELASDRIVWLLLSLSGVNYKCEVWVPDCLCLLTYRSQSWRSPKTRVFTLVGGRIFFRKVYRTWNSYGCRLAGWQCKWW